MLIISPALCYVKDKKLMPGVLGGDIGESGKTGRDSPISELSLVLYAFIRCAANRYIIRNCSAVALSSAFMISCLMISMCSPPHAVTG